jgi:hypothetical protein
MSDTDDVAVLGRRVIERSRRSPLLERIEAFVDDARETSDLKQLRRGSRDRTAMTEILPEEREERL